MDKFIGRNKQLSILKQLLTKKTASLVVIKGRRRIGKSRLAEEFSRLFHKAFIS
jgi:AAA+ ATPase superfamily predicted ATPase